MPTYHELIINLYGSRLHDLFSGNDDLLPPESNQLTWVPSPPLAKDLSTAVQAVEFPLGGKGDSQRIATVPFEPRCERPNDYCSVKAAPCCFLSPTESALEESFGDDDTKSVYMLPPPCARHIIVFPPPSTASTVNDNARPTQERYKSIQALLEVPIP
ncbi:hypothetical protein Tco_0209253 [Tanacetum coccineum]